MSELKIAIENARQNGKAPFCIVATAGTKTTGNMDSGFTLTRRMGAH
jgi:hypothetical protein